jgi:ABC-type branched-subunit amino acid transport system ATPase component
MTQSPEGRQVFGPLTVQDNLRLGAYVRRDKEIDSDRDLVFEMFPFSPKSAINSRAGCPAVSSRCLRSGGR